MYKIFAILMGPTPDTSQSQGPSPVRIVTHATERYSTYGATLRDAPSTKQNTYNLYSTYTLFSDKKYY